MERFVLGKFILTSSILKKKKKEICPANISKINSNCEKQIILLMIPNEEKEGHEVKSERRVAKSKGRRWHYVVVNTLIYIIKRNNIKTLR